MRPVSYGDCLVARLLLLQLLCSCVIPQVQQQISQQPEGSPFDVGPIESCQEPQTTYCTDVTYQVPASIARLTEFIEFEIRNIVEPADDQNVPEECRSVYKETLCRKKFPRCSSQLNQVYFETSENCEERLRESCPNRAGSLTKLGYCNSTQLSLHSRSCRSLSSNNELQHCNLMERDILVSDWMFEHIRQVDLNLQQEYPLRVLSSQSECWQLYRNFLCSAVGQCVGSRVQLINTQETCEAVLNCYSDDFAVLVSYILACRPWPSEQQLLPGIRPTSTPTAPQENTVKEQPVSAASDNYYGWVEPSVRTFVFNSSLRTGGWLFITVTALIVALVCSFCH